MPALPRSLKLGHASYTVAAGRDECEGHGALGICHPDQRRIVVRDDLPADKLREVLLHEALHAAVDVGGRHLFTDDEAEEAVVVALAGPLLDLLRRNPRFLAFLTAD